MDRRDRVVEGVSATLLLDRDGELEFSGMEVDKGEYEDCGRGKWILWGFEPLD